MGVHSRRLRGVRLQLLDFETDAKQIENLFILGGDKCGNKKCGYAFIELCEGGCR